MIQASHISRQVRSAAMNGPLPLVKFSLFVVGASLVCAMAIVASPVSALAQDEGGSEKAESAPPAAAPPPKAGSASASGKDPKKNVVNFEDQLVEGQTQKPELFYLLQQRNANFKRLIRLRENFLPEMKATAEEIGRSGKGASGTNQSQNQGQ